MSEINKTLNKTLNKISFLIPDMTNQNLEEYIKIIKGTMEHVAELSKITKDLERQDILITRIKKFKYDLKDLIQEQEGNLNDLPEKLDLDLQVKLNKYSETLSIAINIYDELCKIQENSQISPFYDFLVKEYEKITPL